MAYSVYSVENGVFMSFMFYSALVLFKTLLMSHLTAYFRVTKKIFGNPEDAVAVLGKAKAREARVTYDDPDVERVRRGHMNDLENIPIFVLLGLLYIATNPTPSIAVWHFRAFAISRFIHTIFQQFIPNQQPRGFGYLIGWCICASFVIQILVATSSYV